jgi:hypothetical protein
MTPAGLDAYTPAPPTPARPAWVITSGDLWARIDGECREAVVEDATGGGLEITMCEEALLTCGVSVAATELLTTSHAWCRQDREQVTEPWAGRVLLLTSAGDDGAVYRQVVQLSAVPIGFEVESQRCSNSSLRALEKHQKKVERTEPDETPPEWTGAQPVFGNRVCVHVDGFVVREGAMNDFSFGMEDVVEPTLPGEVDCRQKCPLDQLGNFAEPNAAVRGKWFHPPGATTIGLYPSWDACQAGGLMEDSGVPSNLCATLGAKFPR